MPDDNEEIEANHWGVEEDKETEPTITSQDDNQSDQGGVNPVIGIILTIVVGVSVMSIGGVFLFDVTGSLYENADMPQITVDESEDKLVLEITEIPNHYDYITVKGPDKQYKLVSGRTITFTNLPDNPNIIVTGTYTEASGLYAGHEESRTILLYDYQTASQTE